MTEATPSPEQIDLLQHSLGIDEDCRQPCRNLFVAGPGHHDQTDLQQLVALGLMVQSPTPGFLDPTDEVFRVTEAGRELALRELPEPTPPAKKHEYRQYQDADGATGDSFAEHLCGSRVPKYDLDWSYIAGARKTWRYRMYRCDGHYRREVEGEWASTKKAAKASYKAALKAFHTARRQDLAPA